MTYQTDTRPPADTVFGPYSQWPRRRPLSRLPRRRTAILGATVVSAAVFVHCGVPMLTGF